MDICSDWKLGDPEIFRICPNQKPGNMDISIGASLSRRAEEGVKRVRPGVVVSAGVGG